MIWKKLKQPIILHVDITECHIFITSADDSKEPLFFSSSIVRVKLQSTLHLVVWKYLVSNISECKTFSSMFWGLFVRKYSKLPKSIQKIDPKSRIFMDSVDKSDIYIYYMFSRKKFIWLYAVYSTYIYNGESVISTKLPSRR